MAAAEPNMNAPVGSENERADFQETALQLSPLRQRIYADFSDEERWIYLASRLNLCGSPEAIVTLVRAVDHVVEHGIAGALVECGVYMGGNASPASRSLPTRMIVHSAV